MDCFTTTARLNISLVLKNKRVKAVSNWDGKLFVILYELISERFQVFPPTHTM